MNYLSRIGPLIRTEEECDTYYQTLLEHVQISEFSKNPEQRLSEEGLMVLITIMHTNGKVIKFEDSQKNN